MGRIQRLIGTTTGRRGWGIYGQWPAMSHPLWGFAPALSTLWPS